MIIKSYEIKKNLKDLKKYNFFLLYGENQGLKKDIRNEIKLSVDQKKNDFEIVSLYEKDLIENQHNFYDSVYTGSLFNVGKIITINDGTDKITEYIEDLFEKFPKNVVMIIFSDILETKSKLRKFFEKNSNTVCIPCYLDNERDLEIIARKELFSNNINISREALNFLIEKSNNDRNNLRNEIEKIKSYSINKKQISTEDLKSLINFSGEYKSDQIVNECLSGNINEYKKILSEIYINIINQILLMRIFSNKVQKLIHMKEVENKYENIDNLVNMYKPSIFWKDKPITKKQLKIWDLNKLKLIIGELNEIEFLCKKNPQISKIILFDFFNKICKQANNYS